MVKQYCDSCGIEMSHDFERRPQLEIRVMDVRSNPVMIVSACEACYTRVKVWMLEAFPNMVNYTRGL